MEFRLQSPFQPTGDQPDAIEQLSEGVRRAVSATRSCWAPPAPARPFTIASVIQQFEEPALIMAHNKTLAAQLYAEFKEFFPENAV